MEFCGRRSMDARVTGQLKARRAEDRSLRPRSVLNSARQLNEAPRVHAYHDRHSDDNAGDLLDPFREQFVVLRSSQQRLPQLRL